MTNRKIKIYKTVFWEVYKKYDRAEDFTNSKIEESCSQENLSVKVVIYF